MESMETHDSNNRAQEEWPTSFILPVHWGQLFSLPCGLVRRLRADPFLKDDAGMTARGNTHGGFAPLGFTGL